MATYTGLLAASAVPVAGTDRWSIAWAMSLALVSAAQWMQWVSIPWWVLVSLAGVLVVRVVYLMVRASERLLITRLWHMAVARSRKTCPRKP